MNVAIPHFVASENTEPVSLRKLAVGEKDDMGHQIEDVLWKGSDYAIYRTGKGVQVQFSDNKDVAHRQRQRYASLCPELCELRYLANQIHTSDFWSKKHCRPTLYDHNIAQAIMLAMEEKDALGRQIAQQALDMAVKRATADNTLIYASYCVFAWVVFVLIGGFTCALLVWLSNHYDWADLKPLEQYALAGTLGATGAMFSIATRLQNLELKPCNRSTLNKFVGGSRILIGSIAGMLVVLLAPDALTDEIKHLIQHLGAHGTMAAALGFVGGFSERLVPNLLRNFESLDGTPAQAARKQDDRSESEGYCGCRENRRVRRFAIASLSADTTRTLKTRSQPNREITGG
jgi:hypothetical protein